MSCTELPDRFPFLKLAGMIEHAFHIDIIYERQSTTNMTISPPLSWILRIVSFSTTISKVWNRLISHRSMLKLLSMSWKNNLLYILFSLSYKRWKLFFVLIWGEICRKRCFLSKYSSYKISSIPCVDFHCHIHEETSRQLTIVFVGTTHCHSLSSGGKDR